MDSPRSSNAPASESLHHRRLLVTEVTAPNMVLRPAVGSVSRKRMERSTLSRHRTRSLSPSLDTIDAGHVLHPIRAIVLTKPSPVLAGNLVVTARQPGQLLQRSLCNTRPTLGGFQPGFALGDVDKTSMTKRSTALAALYVPVVDAIVVRFDLRSFIQYTKLLAIGDMVRAVTVNRRSTRSAGRRKVSGLVVFQVLPSDVNSRY